MEAILPVLLFVAIAAAMSFVRFGLEPLCKALRTAFNAQGPWVSFRDRFFLPLFSVDRKGNGKKTFPTSL
jgi:hypothetical protein